MRLLFIAFLMTACLSPGEACTNENTSRCNTAGGLNRPEMCSGRYWAAGTDCRAVTPRTENWTCCWDTEYRIHACAPAARCREGVVLTTSSGGPP